MGDSDVAPISKEIVAQTTDPPVIAPHGADPPVIILNKMDPPVTADYLSGSSSGRA